MFTRESLGVEEARRAVNAILAATSERDNPIALAITDAHGDLICCVRQDGAGARMVRRARAKAYTAAKLGMNTVVFRDQVLKAQGRTLDDWGDPNLTSLQGGLVVKSNGKVVGGIAMSGNSTKRDEQFASVGLAAMGFTPAE